MASACALATATFLLGGIEVVLGLSKAALVAAALVEQILLPLESGLK